MCPSLTFHIRFASPAHFYTLRCQIDQVTFQLREQPLNKLYTLLFKVLYKKNSLSNLLKNKRIQNYCVKCFEFERYMRWGVVSHTRTKVIKPHVDQMQPQLKVVGIHTGRYCRRAGTIITLQFNK